MKCYNHPDRDAVATCVHCGKSLCKECAEKYQPCLCDNCYKELRNKEIDELKKARKKLIKTFLISIVLALIVYGISGSAPKEYHILLPLIAFFAPYGWNYGNLLGLNWIFGINPAGCLMMMVVYMLRAFMSALIGVFCFFIAIFKYIKIVKAERTAKIEMKQ